MNIVLGSAFRNAAGAQIARWAGQCLDLAVKLAYDDHHIRLVAVEGDSTDNTRSELEKLHFPDGIEIVTCNHGGPVYGSTEHEDRLKSLSKVGNAILESVSESDDILVYVESDLVWDAETIVPLISRVFGAVSYDVVAPLVFAGELFYDVFLFRGLDGERFSPFHPYHLSLGMRLPAIDWWTSNKKFPLIEIESAGSCLVMKAEIARKCRIRDNKALLGFCRDVREKGYHIFVDPTQRIEHP